MHVYLASLLATTRIWYYDLRAISYFMATINKKILEQITTNIWKIKWIHKIYMIRYELYDCKQTIRSKVKN